MAWRISQLGDAANGETTHSEMWHRLIVYHDSTPRTDDTYTHIARIESPRKGDSHAIYHSPKGTWHISREDEPQPVAKPSETLRSLIETHHEHPDQWPVLLDALQEEYPQLWDAIDAHRGARAASEAEQYARAFEQIAADFAADRRLRVTRYAADGTRTVTIERPSEIAAKLQRSDS